MDAGGLTMGVLADTTPQLSMRAQNMIARDKAANSNQGAARKAAEEFEAVFLTTMLEGMFAGLGTDTDSPFGGGSGEQTYRSLLTAEYAKEIAKSGGLGIADQVAREMIAVQEASKR
jgi:Rod binding domain-containing protein